MTSEHRQTCANCDAALAEDQRYCLQCGTRRGNPRIDFTGFWRLSSATVAPESSATGRPHGRAWLGTTPLSARVAGTLAAAVLAAGILAGVALGPGPASSPADSSTLAQRALAALAARGGSGGGASATGSATTPSPTAPTSAPSSPPEHAPASAAASKTTTPSTESASSGEALTEGSSSSEGSSSQGQSSKGTSKAGGAAPGIPVKLPPVKHVWLIALPGESLLAASGNVASNPYLAKQLVPKGTLLSGYTLTSAGEVANGIALLSGQGVNLDIEQGCPTYADVQPATVSPTGLAEGVGCVYPPAVKTLPDQLSEAGLTWKAYVQGMQDGAPDSPSTGAAPSAAAAEPGVPASSGAQAGASPVPYPTTCRHPEAGTADPGQAAAPGAGYATRGNPFVYFHSLLDSGACASDDVDLSQLASDLGASATPPSFSWIAPSACEGGSAARCSAGTARPTAVDAFLEKTVPEILATAAYKEGGLIAIVPDSPPSANPGATSKPVGVLLLSPFVGAGARVSEQLDDFSLLKSLERLFGVLPLGHANDPSAVSFGAAVYRTTK
jgi:phosphatidylinositol-3-phosphatase